MAEVIFDKVQDMGLDGRGLRHWQIDWHCGCIQTFCEEAWPAVVKYLVPGEVFPICRDIRHWRVS